MILKITFQDKIKRCLMPSDFKNLKETISKCFPSNTPFSIYYIDDEKDEILMENEYDFENALLFLLHNNFFTMKITLRPFLRDSPIRSSLNVSVSVNKSIDIKSEDFSFVKPDSQVYSQVNSQAILKCEKCSRKFLQESHAIHSRICNKIFCSKRKPFDSKKQRAVSPTQLVLSKDYSQNKTEIPEKKIKVNRKTRPFSELFVETDSHECFLCNRTFNEKSYRKHERNCYKILLKRPQFQSKEQRIINFEHFLILKEREFFQEKETKKSTLRWKKLSERFRTIMKINKMLKKDKI